MRRNSRLAARRSLGLAGLTALAAGLVCGQPAAVTVPPNVIVDWGLEYAAPGGEALKLDLFRPREASGPLPAVVMIHGGAFVRGDRQATHWLGVALAQEGYAAAAVQYRLAPKHPFPACVRDVKAAVRWLRANRDRYRIAADRIGAIGSSAGGHLALFLALTPGVRFFETEGGNFEQPSDVTCAVSYFGPTDFTRIQGKSKSEEALIPFLGGPIETHRRRYIESSPLFWATPAAAPILLIQGTRDDRVPYEQAIWLAARLHEVGSEPELLLLEGAGHGFTGEDDRRARSATLAFLARHLRPAQTAAVPSESAATAKRLVLVVREGTPDDVLARIRAYLRPGDLVLNPPDPNYPGAMKVPIYVSARTLLEELPGLGGEVRLVCYDPEHWPDTPAEEQQNLLDWVRRASAAVRASGRQFCLTPDARFNRELGEALAPHADFYCLQGQAGQAQLERYADYYRNVAPAVRRANPHALLVAQVTVARPESSAEQALEAWRRVGQFVDAVVPWYNPEPKSLGELLKLLAGLRPESPGNDAAHAGDREASRGGRVGPP